MDPPSGYTPLLTNIDAFVSFVRRRTGDADVAAEVVQEALAKALTHAEALRDDELLLPWFWRILRNTLNDTLARRGRTMQLPDNLAAVSIGERRTICGCLADAMAGLPMRQQEALRRVDLADEDMETAAADFEIDVGNLKVIRHRARQALRKRLEMMCRTCAIHGCLDCYCREPTPHHSAADTPPPGSPPRA